MKPIATLMKPLRSVDLAGMTEAPAVIERSDVCAISAAAVVGEAVVSLVLADAFLEKFGGDSLGEIERNYAHATDRLQATVHRPRRSRDSPDSQVWRGPAARSARPTSAS